MGQRENSWCRLLAQLGSAKKALLLSLLVLFALPSHPQTDGSRHWIEASGQIREEGYELFRIYSVLKKKMEVAEDVLWGIARTVQKESKGHSVDPMLVLAIIDNESRFQVKAVSKEGARGLMQIHPSVAHALAKEAEVHLGHGLKSLDDPIMNIKLGVLYLRSLRNSFKDLKLALAAYNHGPAAVRSRLAEEGTFSSRYAVKVLSTYRSLRKQPPRATD
ncbi:MAG: lytic transglycosylase domain-containing protein [Deltaproteobacteria bacterium]|nr:lytic transglycosylase domain-containing protein [Deltaproteobacteria bacterium]